MRGVIMPASIVPNGAVTAAATPMIRPCLRYTRPRFQFAAVPAIALGNIANNDVPRAIRSEAPNNSDSEGTATAPPPMPSRPDRTPITTPNATSRMPVTTCKWMAESRCGVNTSCETITNTRNAA